MFKNLFENYILGNKISEGAYGILFEGIKKDDKKNVILKIIKCSYGINNIKNYVEKLNNQYIALMNTNEKCFVKVIEVFYSKLGPCIVYEPIELKNLKYYIDNCEIDDMDRTKIFRNITYALKVIHDNSIIHCDLKPENIFVDKKTFDIKVSDIGISENIKIDKYPKDYYISERTIQYMSPETLYSGEFSKQSDIWALGIILYEMICNKQPFYGNHSNIYSNIINGKYEPLIKGRCKNWEYNIMPELLNINKNERISDCSSILKIVPINDRDSKFYPTMEEYVNAVSEVLEREVLGMEENDAIKEASKQIGRYRIGKETKKQFQKAIKLGIKEKIISINKTTGNLYKVE